MSLRWFSNCHQILKRSIRLSILFHFLIFFHWTMFTRRWILWRFFWFVIFLAMINNVRTIHCSSKITGIYSLASILNFIDVFHLNIIIVFVLLFSTRIQILLIKIKSRILDWLISIHLMLLLSFFLNFYVILAS